MLRRLATTGRGRGLRAIATTAAAAQTTTTMMTMTMTTCLTTASHPAFSLSFHRASAHACTPKRSFSVRPASARETTAIEAGPGERRPALSSSPTVGGRRRMAVRRRRRGGVLLSSVALTAAFSSGTQPQPHSSLSRCAARSMSSCAKPLLTRRIPTAAAVAVRRPLLPAALSFAARARHVRHQSSDDKPPAQPPTARFTPAGRENIYTVPNFLTVTRLLAAPVVGYCIVHDQAGAALALLAAAGVTDLLDGWVARRWRLHTVVGSILDPLADKVLMTVLVVSLAAQGGLPLWLAALVLGRDAGLGVAAVYYRWISLPPPKTLARYWDFSLPSAEVRPTTISKYNTFLQLALMAATTAAPVVAATTWLGGPWDLGPALTVMQYVVAATTVWSGASYVYSKDAVKILTQNKAKGK